MAAPVEVEPLLTVHIVARRLGESPKSVYEWISPDRCPYPLPHFRVGKRAVRFYWSEVQRWLEQRRVRP